MLHARVMARFVPGRGYEAKLRAEALSAPILDWGQRAPVAFPPAHTLHFAITEAMARETFERVSKLVAEEYGWSSGRFRKVKILAIVV